MTFMRIQPVVLVALSALIPFLRASTSADISTRVSPVSNLTSYVNLFIGTAEGANGASGGNALPGPGVPHAMVKVSAASCAVYLHG